MIVTDSMKHAVSVWIGQTLTTLDRLDILDDLKVEWNPRFTSKMGSARIKALAREMSVRFSMPLWPRATPKERRETTVHEVCHIVAYQIAWEQGEKIQPHGPEWQALMLRCGVQPERTHSVDNKGLSKRKRINVSCGCQTIDVTPYVAGRMAAGVTYRCRRCKVQLKPPPGTKPVERRKRRRRGRK